MRSFLVLSCFISKQKTAYEMRISYWSSDVCSSDLDFGRVGADHVDADHHGGLRMDDQLVERALVAVGEHILHRPRSEERRGGIECVSTCRSRWSTSH